jgi:hypothetical protein
MTINAPDSLIWQLHTLCDAHQNSPWIVSELRSLIKQLEEIAALQAELARHMEQLQERNQRLRDLASERVRALFVEPDATGRK